MGKKNILLAAAILSVCFAPARAQQTLQEATDSIKNVLAEARQGNADAQNEVGAWYYQGKHVTQNYEEAAKWWALAAKQGNMMATGNLAMCYQTGNGVRQDSIYAFQLYNTSIKGGNAQLLQANERLAEAGNIFYCVQVASCFQRGIGTQRNLDKAKAYYEKAANKGSVDAMRELGLLFLNAKNPDDAYKWLSRGAKRGNLTCLFWTGTMLMEGLGVSQDKEQGFNMLLQAANEGFPNAQYEVANAYLNGNGTVKNIDSGISWLKKAANNEVAKAQYQLALCYINGEGVPMDYDMAANWLAVCSPRGMGAQLAKALEPDGELANSPFHAYLLGMHYYYANDFDKALDQFKLVEKAKRSEGKLWEAIILMNPAYAKHNQKKGLKALQEAAKNDVPMALYWLGTCYETGECGIEPDAALAIEYLVRAGEQGQPNAICYLADMYYEGRGIAQNYDKAVKLYNSVRALLTPTALKRLASCYENGWGGLPVDKKEAETLLKRQSGTIQALTANIPE